MLIIAADELRIDGILALDKECISPPWTHGQMLSEIYSEHAVFELAVRNGAILGFYVLRRLGDEAELLRIAVSAKVRRQGIGGKLMESIIKKAKGSGAVKVFLEVRKSNTAAISMYEKYGFKHLGLRRAYYDDPVEDAYMMTLEI